MNESNRKAVVTARLIEKYGLEGKNVSNCLAIASGNLHMTIKDGTPQCIPGTDFLYIGSIGSAYNRDSLIMFGITDIMCLSSEILLKFPDRFKYCRFDIEDSVYYDIASIFSSCIQFINDAKERGGRVLVHCYQGKSRSATICCAYLMCVFGLSVDDALASVRCARPIASPNVGFMTALHKYYKQLHT